PMLVAVLAADPRLVNLDNAAELRFWLNERGTYPVRHVPSGFQGAKSHIAPQLSCAPSFLAGQDQMSNLEPVAQRLVRVFENRASDNAETITSRRALLALPVEWPRAQRIDLIIPATRTANAVRPTAGLQISLASILVADRKHHIELCGRK